MTSTDRKATVQRYFDEVINGRSRAAVDELVASPMLAENIKTNMDTLEAIVSNLQPMVDAMVEEGDTVALFCTLSGKHTGEFQTPWITAPPTGRDVMIPYAYRFQVEGERIASLTVVSDIFRLLVQITAEDEAQ